MKLLDNSRQEADGTCNREVRRSFSHAFWFRVDKTISDLRISWADLENLLEDRLCCLICHVSPDARLYLVYGCHDSSRSVSNRLEKMKSFPSSDRAEMKEDGVVASSLNDTIVSRNEF